MTRYRSIFAFVAVGFGTTSADGDKNSASLMHRERHRRSATRQAKFSNEDEVTMISEGGHDPSLDHLSTTERPPLMRRERAGKSYTHRIDKSKGGDLMMTNEEKDKLPLRVSEISQALVEAEIASDGESSIEYGASLVRRERPRRSASHQANNASVQAEFPSVNEVSATHRSPLVRNERHQKSFNGGFSTHLGDTRPSVLVVNSGGAGLLVLLPHSELVSMLTASEEYLRGRSPPSKMLIIGLSVLICCCAGVILYGYYMNAQFTLREEAEALENSGRDRRHGVGGPGGLVLLDDVLSRIGLGWFHVRLCTTCGFGFAAVSCQVILTAFLFPELRKVWHVSEYQLAVNAILTSYGSMIGKMICAAAADKFGRRFVFIIAVFIVTLGGGATATTTNLVSCNICRFIVGFGYGGSSAVDMAYYTEFLPTQGRGAMFFWFMTAWPVGQIATCVLAWWVIPRFGWQWFAGVCTIPSLMALLLRLVMPESPRWLLANGYAEKATRVCCQIALGCGKRPEDVGLLEGTEVSLGSDATLPTETSGEVGWRLRFVQTLCELFGRRYVWSTVGLLICNAVLFVASYGALTFMPSLLEMKGMTTDQMYITMVLSSASGLLGIALVALCSMNLGRLFLLRLMLPSIAIPFLCFGFAKNVGTQLICSCAASVFTEICFALINLYTQEVYPTQLRARGNAITFITHPLTATLAPMGAALSVQREHSTQGTKAHGNTAILFFASTCIIGALSAWLCLHKETRNRDLRDIISDSD